MPTALVTGANRGIGLALVKQLAARGDQVIAACRQPSPELEKTGARIVAGVELTAADQVAALARQLDDTFIDLLILNAGILRGDDLDGLDIDVVREQIEVNAVAPLRVVQALRPRLRPGGKVAAITSRMGSIADNGSGGYYGYRMSKAALNAMSVSLARDLRVAKIAVAILHPGFVRTDMTGGSGNVTADDAAKQLLQRIDGLTLDNTGTFWHANGEVLPW
jgi:NAD(P)-dependent dehydrogenase (short-subunit alcohol dehydrogenase family)